MRRVHHNRSITSLVNASPPGVTQWERLTLIRRVIFSICLLTLPALALAQQTSALSGAVTGPDEEPIADAPIQITHAESGAQMHTRSDVDGGYRFSDLDSGAYALSIAMQCCAYESFSEETIDVTPGATRHFDIRLEQGGSLNTLGDDPITIANAVRERQIIPDLPVPRMADGKPDLTGVWLVNADPFPQKPLPLPWAKQVLDERMANGRRDHPHNRCLPGGLPIPNGSSPSIGKFVQTNDLVVILLEDVPGYRQIFLDGREHPLDPNPSWMGHSTARWVNDVLVVDTVGFNDRGWTNTFPRTEKMRMTERYQRIAYGRMVAEVTITDERVFSAPWTRNMSFDLAPQEELIEYVCENNKWAPEALPGG